MFINGFSSSSFSFSSFSSIFLILSLPNLNIDDIVLMLFRRLLKEQTIHYNNVINFNFGMSSFSNVI